MKTETDWRDLAAEHVPLARWWARRHRPANRLHADDRLSAALTGLVEAAMRHDPALGPFAPYAGRAIRRHIDRAMWDNRAVRLPYWLANPDRARSGRPANVAAAERARDVAPLDAATLPPAAAEDPSARAERAEEEARALAAFDRLDERSRRVLAALADGVPVRALADELRLTRARVYQIAKSARASLWAALEGVTAPGPASTAGTDSPGHSAPGRNC